MTFLVILGYFGCFLAGGALIWFGRNTIEKMVIGANALSRKLHAKADEIAAATKR
jgi:hypothetical protein